MENLNVLKRHVLEKQVTLHFKLCGLKKYGKKVGTGTLHENKTASGIVK